jgi:hypothetical protein
MASMVVGDLTSESPNTKCEMHLKWVEEKHVNS